MARHNLRGRGSASTPSSQSSRSFVTSQGPFEGVSPRRASTLPSGRPIRKHSRSASSKSMKGGSYLHPFSTSEGTIPAIGSALVRTTAALLEFYEWYKYKATPKDTQQVEDLFRAVCQMLSDENNGLGVSIKIKAFSSGEDKDSSDKKDDDSDKKDD